MFGKSQAEIVKEAMEAGAKIALDGVRLGQEVMLESLRRQGRVSSGDEAEVSGPVHIDDFEDYTRPEPVADIDEGVQSEMEARSERFINQMFSAGMNNAK